ncbi:MAG: M56 family metallopeptidase, partial [Candidatus Aminicenantaceae bacterium]
MAGPAAGTQGQLFSFSDILWFSFLIGAAFFLLRFALQLTQILLLIRKYGYHIYDGVKVVVTDTETAPFSFFNFLFISNSDITDHGFERILTHEMTHIKQYHSIDLLFMELLTIFQWFNPFVWPYKKSLKETHEYLADHAVIAQGCSRAKYQLLIFEQHVGLNMFEFTNNFSQSLIKRRITMMAKIKSNGRAKLKILLIFPVIALLALAFAESKPVPTKPLDEAVISQPDNLSQPQDKKADEAAKKKQHEKQEKATEILEKEAKLKAMYKETDDPKKKEKIKAELVKIAEWKENNGVVKVKKKEMGEENYKAAVKELKAAYEKTDDP